MATFADLQTLTLSWLDDPNAGYFTLPQVNVWLNNALREAQKQLIQAGENWYAVCATMSTVANAGSYALPTDFLKENKLELVTQAGTTNTQPTTQLIVPVTLVQGNQVSEQVGAPVAYFLKKNCVNFRPVPDQVYTIKLTYSYRVSDMSVQTQQPDLPEQYHEYLAVLATLDGFLKDQRDPSPMLEKKRQYLDLMKQDAQNRTLDFPREVVCSDDYSTGWFY